MKAHRQPSVTVPTFPQLQEAGPGLCLSLCVSRSASSRPLVGDGGCLLSEPLPLQCYLFHMYVGVRAGGGIGDEIEDPAGDEYELYRVVFDITFFFFVIIILLAIIQGQCWLGVWV